MSTSADCRDRAWECLHLASASSGAEKAIWLRWAMHWRRMADFAEQNSPPATLTSLARREPGPADLIKDRPAPEARSV